MKKWSEKDNIKEEEKNISDYLNLDCVKQEKKETILSKPKKHDYKNVVPDILYKRKKKQ